MKIQTVVGGTLKTVGEVEDLRKGLSLLKIYPDLVLFDGEKHIISVEGKLTTLENIRHLMEEEEANKVPLHREPSPFETEEDVRKERMEQLRKRNLNSLQEKIRQVQTGIRNVQEGLARGLRGESELSRVTDQIFRGR